MVIKGSLTATSSTSLLWSATLATKRPILPNPEHRRRKVKVNMRNGDPSKPQARKIKIIMGNGGEGWLGGMEVPLIPILIFAMADEEEERRYKR